MPELPTLQEIWADVPLLEEAWPLVVLALRLAVVALLYVFLLSAFRALYAELRRAPVAAGAAPDARVEVAEGGAGGAWIEIVDHDGDDGLVGRRYPLEPVTVVGRRPGSTALLPDPRVSARHARLVARDGGWWVEDLDSTNGTYIDERRVSRPVRVDANAELRFGPVVARLAAATR